MGGVIPYMRPFERHPSGIFSQAGSLAPHVQNVTLTAFLPSSLRRYSRADLLSGQACMPVASWRHERTSARYRGMFRIRVKTGHKNTAEDVRPGKTTACMVAQVGSHSPRSSIRAEAGVRKRFCQSVIQHAVFTRMKLNRSSVREGLLFWTDFPMAGFYTYPELTHTNTSSR
jgi:hypothetical protein